MALPRPRSEMCERLIRVGGDVDMAGDELRAMDGNPHHAVAYLKRARSNIDAVLEELSKEGVV